jgi:hypothetical protein
MRNEGFRESNPRHTKQETAASNPENYLNSKVLSEDRDPRQRQQSPERITNEGATFH